MAQLTSRLKLPYPEGNDAADVPSDVRNLALSIDKAAIVSQGTLAQRPISTVSSPGINGRFFYVTGDPTAANNGILWFDTGSGWSAVNSNINNVQLSTDAVDSRVLGDQSVGIANFISGVSGKILGIGSLGTYGIGPNQTANMGGVTTSHNGKDCWVIVAAPFIVTDACGMGFQYIRDGVLQGFVTAALAPNREVQGTQHGARKFLAQSGSHTWEVRVELGNNPVLMGSLSHGLIIVFELY